MKYCRRWTWGESQGLEMCMQWLVGNECPDHGEPVELDPVEQAARAAEQLRQSGGD